MHVELSFFYVHVLYSSLCRILFPACFKHKQRILIIFAHPRQHPLRHSYNGTAVFVCLKCLPFCQRVSSAKRTLILKSFGQQKQAQLRSFAFFTDVIPEMSPHLFVSSFPRTGRTTLVANNKATELVQAVIGSQAVSRS